MISTLPASALAAAAAATTTETLQLLNDDDSMEIPHDTTTDEENDSDLDIPYETGHEQGQRAMFGAAARQRQREPLRPGDVSCYNHIADVIYRNGSEQCNALLKVLVLQLYRTGYLLRVKESFVELLAEASCRGILVVAATQRHTGAVLLGHYAVGRALIDAGVSLGSKRLESQTDNSTKTP
jgi:hypothetical protein